jgi:ribose 5-phosphate isomerase B
MKIVIAADHAGYQYKSILVKDIQARGVEVIDIGAFNELPSDYPDFAAAVAKHLLQGDVSKGILICGSGVGVAIAANKFRGIRAGVCHDAYSAHQSVEHDNVNVLCIGERVIGIEVAREVIHAFLAASFSNEERHLRRLNKVLAIEERNMVQENSR